jgi:hypothetical protein
MDEAEANALADQIADLLETATACAKREAWADALLLLMEAHERAKRLPTKPGKAPAADAIALLADEIRKH